MRLLPIPSRLVLVLLGCFIISLAAGGCHRTNIQQSLRTQVTAQGQQPVLLAVYEPWFGDRDHIDVGYSSHERSVLEKQITQAQNLGISAFVVDWYGPRKKSLDSNYALLQQVASEKSFQVTLMYDEPQDDPEHSTEAAISSLEFAYEHYIGPHAVDRGAYLTYDGAPVIFVWPRSRQTDWKRVREYLQSWEQRPILINEDGAQESGYGEQFDGFYAWVKPGKRGWAPDGRNWGREYLESFYQKMTTKYPAKIAVGAAWPGFNDSKASWGQNRYMSARCGKTFADSLHLFRRYYDESRPLPFLLIITWNDYEEGTAIEHGLQTCS